MTAVFNRHKGLAVVHQYRPTRPNEEVIDAVARFGNDIVCDGATHALIKRFVPPTGAAWVLRWPVDVEVVIGDYSDALSVGEIYAQKQNSFSLVAGGIASVETTVRIRRMSVIDNGDLRVVISFTCPEKDAGFYMYAASAVDDEHEPHRTRGDPYVCDGTQRRLRAYFGSDPRRPWTPTDPVLVQVRMYSGTEDESPAGYGGIYAAFESVYATPSD
jgi:hypothetical protein